MKPPLIKGICQREGCGAEFVSRERCMPRKYCTDHCKRLAFQERDAIAKWTKPSYMKEVEHAVRNLPWSHPFVALIRKAVECGKTRNRKLRRMEANGKDKEATNQN